MSAYSYYPVEKGEEYSIEREIEYLRWLLSCRVRANNSHLEKTFDVKLTAERKALKEIAIELEDGLYALFLFVMKKIDSDQNGVQNYQFITFEYLRASENLRPIKPYLHHQPEMTVKMRKVLIDWLVEVSISL